MTETKLTSQGPDTLRSLRQRLEDNADYMEGRHGGPPATIETDSDLWRTTIQLQRDAASALASKQKDDFAFHQRLRETPQYVEAEREASAVPHTLSAEAIRREPGKALAKIERLRSLLAWFTLRYQIEKGSALASPPEHDEQTKILRASEQPAASGPAGSPRSSQPGGSE